MKTSSNSINKIFCTYFPMSLELPENLKYLELLELFLPIFYSFTENFYYILNKISHGQIKETKYSNRTFR